MKRLRQVPWASLPALVSLDFGEQMNQGRGSQGTGGRALSCLDHSLPPPRAKWHLGGRRLLL